MIIDKKYELGLRVYNLRKERGYTKERLAEIAEISVGFLGDVENGKKGISADTLARLAAALRVSSDKLLYGTMVDDQSVGILITTFSEQEQENLKRIFKQCIKVMDDIKTSGRQ